MTKTAPRARYTLEFKKESVRLVVRRPAQRRRVHSAWWTRHQFNWVKAPREDKLTGVGSKAVSVELMEIRRLRAELARVKMERDSLEKATAYCAQAAK